MASKVGICNLALTKLGADVIASLTSGTREAAMCNTLFDDLAREVMVEGAWTSTIRRATLNKVSTAPEWGYDSRFQLPTSPKCLKVLSINDNSPGDYDYRIEGDKLLINASSVKIEYVGEITDTQSYGEFLKQAIVSKLTAELAYPITGDKALAQSLWEKYKVEVRENLAKDGQQGAGIRVISPDLLTVRGDSPDTID